MIISYGKNGTSGGAVEYVTETKGKEREGATVLRGDPELTKRLIEESPYKLKYRSGVISFEEKEISKKDRDEILDLFEKSTFAGLEKDQYNVLFVEHKDTDNYHIHFVIPRQELKTGKSFNPHWHVQDQNRLLKLQEYINAEYGYSSAFDQDKRQTFVNDTKQINRKSSKEQINSVVENEITHGRIQNRNDVISFFENNGITVNRVGKDYISLKFDQEKVRLKGLYYAETFTNLRAVGAELNRADEANRATTRPRRRELRAELDSYIQRKAEHNQRRYSQDHSQNGQKRATIEKQANPSHEHSLNPDRVNFSHVVRNNELLHNEPTNTTTQRDHQRSTATDHTLGTAEHGRDRADHKADDREQKPTKRQHEARPSDQELSSTDQRTKSVEHTREVSRNGGRRHEVAINRPNKRSQKRSNVGINQEQINDDLREAITRLNQRTDRATEDRKERVSELTQINTFTKRFDHAIVTATLSAKLTQNFAKRLNFRDYTERVRHVANAIIEGVREIGSKCKEIITQHEKSKQAKEAMAEIRKFNTGFTREEIAKIHAEAKREGALKEDTHTQRRSRGHSLSR